MSFDYSRMVEVANRGVANFGTQAHIIRHIDGGDPELPPLRPWEGTTQPEDTVAAYPCNILIGNYKGVELASDTIQIGDVKVMVAREGLLIEPQLSDMIQLSGEDRAFQIVDIRAVMPGGVVIYWEIQAR